jgi:4-hydroxy-3-methylbut-2-enyl diphosphate reductase
VTEKQPMTVLLCGPRGFCAGVDRAIQIVVLAIKKYGAPVYVRHEIVHNRYVVEGLEAKGAIFVDTLSEIPETTQPVIFSAHGVPKSVPEAAIKRNLHFLDATCPLVSKVHKQALLHLKRGRHVLLVGHQGHPEVIGTMGQLPEGTVSLIETVEDAKNYVLSNSEPVGYVTQTTLSIDDTVDIIAQLKDRFDDLAAPSAESICYATTNRQEAVKAAAPGCDYFFVVGAPNSSNSCRLVEVAERSGANIAMLVQNENEIPWDDLVGKTRIGISAGASAPEVLIEEILESFKSRFAATIELAETTIEDEEFLVMRDLRQTPLEAGDMAFVNGE